MRYDTTRVAAPPLHSRRDVAVDVKFCRSVASTRCSNPASRKHAASSPRPFSGSSLNVSGSLRLGGYRGATSAESPAPPFSSSAARTDMASQLGVVPCEAMISGWS